MVSRRKILISGGLAGAAAIGAVSTPSLAGATSRRTDARETPQCILTPETIEGPYFIDDLLVRSDVREDQAGRRLDLQLKVVDATTCHPVKGASVEIWHCNAQGYYSGHLDQDPDVEAPSPEHVPPTDPSIFLRGTQYTDHVGRVHFTTIFPGWYAGRTVHIHTMVSLGEQEVHTGQLYFTESVTAQVMTGSAYYRAPGSAPRVRNDQDNLYLQDGGAATTVHLAGGSGPLSGGITVGVNRSASSA